MFRKCTNPKCFSKTGIPDNIREKCLSSGPKVDSVNNRFLAQHELLQEGNARVVKQEIREISSPLYSDFHIAGKFDSETSAARWLQRLRYDFLCTGISNPSPNRIITAINMLAQGEVAVFIDSKYRAMCDKSDHSFADPETLESAPKNAFPRRYSN